MVDSIAEFQSFVCDSNTFSQEAAGGAQLFLLCYLWVGSTHCDSSNRPAAAELQGIVDGLSLARCSCCQWAQQVHTAASRSVHYDLTASWCMYASLYYHRGENLDQVAANYSSLYAGILSMGLDGIWTLKPLMNVSLWQQSYVYHNSMVC